jgi:hypothetical protein
VINRRILKKARLLKSSRSYSSPELAEALQVHPRTVQAWRKRGMTAVGESMRPYLFMGHEVIRFLTELGKSGKVELKPGEHYCLRCRKGITPVPETVTRIIQSESVSHRLRSVRLVGSCPECGSKANRFDVENTEISTFPDVSGTTGERRLIESLRPVDSTDLERVE